MKMTIEQLRLIHYRNTKYMPVVQNENGFGFQTVFKLGGNKLYTFDRILFNNATGIEFKYLVFKENKS